MRTTIEDMIEKEGYTDANDMVKTQYYNHGNADEKAAYKKAYAEWIKGNKGPMNDIAYTIFWEWGYVY